jgi:two-component system, sensor histidine kinase
MTALSNTASPIAALDDAIAPHPRLIGWFGASGLAMGGSNQSLFLMGAVFAAQGSAAVPLLVFGLLLSVMATPGWIELGCMYPHRVGGIAATCAEAFRPYSEVLANLTGVCYWWGWVPTCGLTALLSASAIHQWYLPGVPVTPLAIGIVATFTAVNLCGVKWATRIAGPMACVSAALALLSTVLPVWAHKVSWHRASTFHLITPFHGMFGALTSAMAGLYIIGFAAPAFEAASCHIGEMRNPDRDHPRAMWVSAGVACIYFVFLPVVWLGVFGSHPLEGDLVRVIGPTFAPLFGGMAKATAIWFLAINMFHGTLHPLSGASRTLSQLSEDGLLPRIVARRNRWDAPWFAVLLTATWAVLFLLAGDPIWMIAGANLTYLIGIALPSVAVWLLRRNEPERHRPYRARRGMIGLGLLAAFVWLLSTLFGFEQFGLPTVLFAMALAYSGSIFYAWRKWTDNRGSRSNRRMRSMHLKLTGAMLAVLTLDGAGYFVAVQYVDRGQVVLVTVLSDIFVAVALLTISVGLILPGMIAHASRQVAVAADRLATGTLADFTRAMEALASGDLDAAHARVDEQRVVVHSRDEIGLMAESFNVMQGEVTRAAIALDGAREELRAYRDRMEELVSDRTLALRVANADLEEAQSERRRLLDRTVEAAEDERSRLAADLHDGPIQSLAALGITLDRCSLRLNRGDLTTSRELLATLRDKLSIEIGGLRRLMAELRPPALDHSGLEGAIRDYTATFARQNSLDCAVDVDLAHRPAADVEVVLYRVLQEALTNVGKHADASLVHVGLQESAEGTELTVADNGRGMPRDPRSDSELLRAGHFGLAGMRERLARAGGHLRVVPTHGQGTTIRAWLPTLPVTLAASDAVPVGASSA